MTPIEPQSPFVVPEAVLPLRAQAAESAEMVTQMLLGEGGVILAHEGPWCQVRRNLDGYEGWVDTKMIEPVPMLPAGLGQGPWVLGGRLTLSDHTQMPLPMGIQLPAGVSPSHPSFGLGAHQFQISSDLQLTAPFTLASVVATTELFFHTPYLWGGISSFGIDCSGLVQTVFRMCGVVLPRDASQQISHGTAVAFEARQAGDLAFFSKINQSRITHVGILSDPQHILHASGHVRRDPFSAAGIVHALTGHLTHQLISIRRC
jgi:hypothetical protein